MVLVFQTKMLPQAQNEAQQQKEMVTKGVSTADLEDSQSSSTESGSVETTSLGKVCFFFVYESVSHKHGSRLYHVIVTCLTSTDL